MFITSRALLLGACCGGKILLGWCRCEVSRLSWGLGSDAATSVQGNH